ncbi:MAG: tetratricopeptide repeat protein [Alphaproteobacteria bacterium]|nr:tetratricopeptide repeat protein [Alphaproteobacteria bacterium]
MNGERPDDTIGAAARIARGSRLLASGHAEAALAAFRAAAAGPAALQSIAEDGLGRAWLALDQPELALAHFDRAVAAQTTPLATILADRAWALLRLGRADGALAAADQALAGNPTEARALAARAEVASARGEGGAWAPSPQPVTTARAAEPLASALGQMLVGIAWRSDRQPDPALADPPGTPGADRFSAPLDPFLRYLAPFGARLVALRTTPADPRTQLLASRGIVIDPGGTQGMDDAGLAAIIANLDLVVAVDSRVAELAGLLGRPAIVLLPTGVIGRWPHAAAAPHRRALTVLRQEQPGDWDPVFRRAADLLAGLLRKRKPPAPVRPPKPVAERAAAALAEGHRLHAAGNSDAAADSWRRALTIDPGLAAAWANLGVAMRIAQEPEAAIVCYRQALGLGGAAAGTLGNLGNALKDLDRLDEAVAIHQKSVALEPQKAGGFQNLGIALRQAGRYREAIAAFDRALAIDPRLHTVRWDQALARLHTGDFAGGWPLYESRWDIGDLVMPNLAAALWDGGPLDGKTILLHSEQGFGDAIQCVRYAQALKQRGAARVVLDCKPPLVRLFQTAPGVDAIVPRGAGLPPHDLHCPLNSLPGRFGTDTTNIPGAIPFLRAPANGVDKFRPSLALAGTRLKVGIVWSGSVTFKDNHHRATTLARFLRHFGLAEVCLFSLQKGPPEAELKALGADTPLVDLAPLIEDFADTASAIGALDLVLMTDSSVAHLAGALGTPVWVLLPFHAHWLWLENDRDTTPWYPSMRFFRQPSPNDWEAPFARAADELLALAKRQNR